MFIKGNIVIVVIEDDPVYSQLITRYLKGNLKCEIWSFDTAVTSLHSKGLKPDIVFIDLVLKDLDGRSLSRMIRKKWKSSVIVVMSSNDNVLTINKTTYGIDETVSKTDSLKEILKKALRAYRTKILKKAVLVTGILVLVVLLGILIRSVLF